MFTQAHTHTQGCHDHASNTESAQKTKCSFLPRLNPPGRSWGGGSKFCILRDSPRSSSGSGPRRASACPLKVDASAGLLHLPGWHFYFSLNSNTHLLKHHRGGGVTYRWGPLCLGAEQIICTNGPSGAWLHAGPRLQGQCQWRCQAGRKGGECVQTSLLLTLAGHLAEGPPEFAEGRRAGSGEVGCSGMARCPTLL